MKKYIVPAVFGVVFVGLNAAAVSHYNNYQKTVTKTAQVKAAQVAKDKQIVEQRYSTVSTAYDNERVECEKGAAAWSQLLTVTPKAANPKPVCGPAVVK